MFSHGFKDGDHVRVTRRWDADGRTYVITGIMEDVHELIYSLVFTDHIQFNGVPVVNRELATWADLTKFSPGERDGVYAFGSDVGGHMTQTIKRLD